MKKKFLYYPIIYLLILFTLDKIIFNNSYFQKTFLQTGNVVYFRHRELLFEKLKKNYPFPNKKLVIALGDSRAYAFSETGLSADREKKYSIYNFSGPQAVPAYSLYWTDKIVNASIKPALIFLVVNAEGFDDRKMVFHKPFLRLGADDEFVNKYKLWIPKDDLYEYYLDRFIALRRVELDYKLLIKRIQEGKLREYNPAYNQEFMELSLFNGEKLSYIALANDVKRLQKDSVRMQNIYFSNYRVDDTQFKFIEELLLKAKNQNIKVYVIRSKVYKDYRESTKKYNLEETLEKRMKEISLKYDARYFNFNEESECDIFYDASHQSTQCYFEQMNYMLSEFENGK